MYVTKHYELRRLKKISDYVAGKHVLDVGYAALPNPYLSEFHCVGYDMVETNNFPKHYTERIMGDAENIEEKLQGRTFDTVICGELVEHLENPYSFLRKVRNLINPDGRLIVSTPNPLGFPVFFAELFRLKRFFYTTDHTYYFLPRWAERLIGHTGYNLIKSEAVGFWMPGFVIPCMPTIMSYQIVYVAELKN